MANIEFTWPMEQCQLTISAPEKKNVNVHLVITQRNASQIREEGETMTWS